MLVSKTNHWFNRYQKYIIEIGVDPQLERFHSFWNGEHDLIFNAVIEVLKEGEDKFSAKGEIDVLPVEYFGVIVESNQHLYFRKGPAVYLL
jgi:hypothetical protein